MSNRTLRVCAAFFTALAPAAAQVQNYKPVSETPELNPPRGLNAIYAFALP